MELHGVIVYDILNNDCLTGVWTNNDHKLILTETARKFNTYTDPIILNSTIEGDYICSYIDADSITYNGTLHITKEPNKLTYNFNWTVDGRANAFTGIGFIFQENKIAVSYTD